jgi:hypothetical protein
VNIIRRAQWGARYADGFDAAPLPAREVWGHHSVTVAPDLLPPYDDEDAAMRTLEKIGQDRFSRGVSYTFAIMPTGRVYEGHGVGRQGSHTAGRNSIARAIVFVGNYETQKVTAQQIESAAQLLAHGWRAGWWTAPRLNGGHRDAPGAATACPGRHVTAAIPTINARAAALAAPPKGTPMALTKAEIDQIAQAVWGIVLPQNTQYGGTVIPPQKPQDRIATNVWHVQLGAVDTAGVALPRQKAWERVNAMHALGALQKMEHGKLVAQLAGLDPKSIAEAVPLEVAGAVVAALLQRAHAAPPPPCDDDRPALAAAGIAAEVPAWSGVAEDLDELPPAEPLDAARMDLERPAEEPAAAPWGSLLP